MANFFIAYISQEHHQKRLGTNSKEFRKWLFDTAKYMLTAVLLYCVAVFVIQAFSLRHIEITLLRILSSTLLTFLVLLGFDSIATTRREKRL